MERKRANGQGCIYYRKDRKSWVVQYYEMENSINRKKTKSFASKENAQRYLEALMCRMENPLFIEKNGIPLRCIMENIAQNKLDANSISIGQFERINNVLKQIFVNEIVNKNIETITSDEIQRVVNSYVKYSDSTIRKIVGQFRQAFKYAYDKGYIIRNPMEQVIKPKSSKDTKDIRAMTIEEERKFIDYLKEKTIEECTYKNVYLIQLFTGVRVGECLALNINDIDLEKRRIYVHKTLTSGRGQEVIMSKSTKTNAGKRYLPMPDGLYPYITEQIGYCLKQKNNDEKLLFKPPFNKYTDSRNVNRILSKILNELEIEHMATHSLRHTYATRSIEAGISPVVLQKLMGHSDISITLNTYTNVFDKYKETEFEKINRYYKREKLI